MKNPFVVFAIVLCPGFSTLASAGEDSPPLQFFSGAYRVVGVHPDTQIPYQGLCEIEAINGEEGVMKRTINGNTVEATFRIETFEDTDRQMRTKLVARFSEGGNGYAITYNWQIALHMVGDNFPLLTGIYGSKGAGRSLVQAFELLKPTMTNAGDLREKLEDELADPESNRISVARVLEAISPAPESESGRRESLTPAPHTTGHTGLSSLRSGHADLASPGGRR